jgi:hypothetical protein
MCAVMSLERKLGWELSACRVISKLSCELVGAGS